MDGINEQMYAYVLICISC